MAEDTDETEQEMQATLALLRMSRKIAHKYKVCPSCLIFNTAVMVEDMLEAGRIEHGVLDGEDAFISRATH